MKELTLKTCASEKNRELISNALLEAINAMEDLKSCHPFIIADIKAACRDAIDNVFIHAYPNEKGDIEICINIKDDNKVLEVKVSDWGIGIKDVNKARQPLFTTKEGRSGMGFTFIEAFSSKVTVESTPGKGTVVTMSFQIA